MSEASRGPDWWLASDGKWYPPESHLDSTPPAPAGPPLPPTPGRESSRIRVRTRQVSRLYTVGLVATIVAGVALGFFWALTLSVGEETNCTAHRGSAYQDCLRANDLNGVPIQAAVTGLAAFGFVVLTGDALRGRLHKLPRFSNQKASDATARDADDRREHEQTSPRPLPATSARPSLLTILAVTVLSGGLLVLCVLTWIWGLQGGWAPDRPFPYEPIAKSEANNTIVIGLFVGATAGALVATWPPTKTWVSLARRRAP